MAWDVHIHVCFACDRNDGVAQLARRCLGGLQGEGIGHSAAIWFLTDLSERSGHNRGPKGGLSLWGMVGNHTRAETFCEALRPFWSELLSGEIDGGPLYFERVVVFEEPEQSGAANAFQIGFEDEPRGRVLMIRKFEKLPFSWHQS